MLKGQFVDTTSKEKSIRVQAGFMFDNYNSAGLRLYVAYQQQFNPNSILHWGIGYDTKYATYRMATDIYDPPELSTSNFSFNIHYHLKIWKGRILWDINAGPAIAHAHENDNNYFLYGLHAGVNFNFKLTKHIYFETAPLVFIPAGTDFYMFDPKAYHSKYEGYSAYFQFTTLPFGFRFIL